MIKQGSCFLYPLSFFYNSYGKKKQMKVDQLRTVVYST